MKTTFPVQHCLLLEYLEIVVCDGHRFFIVDRARDELRNILDPGESLPLVQRQIGRLPNGELEVLERYETVDERGEALVLDSSPTRLDELPRLNL